MASGRRGCIVRDLGAKPAPTALFLGSLDIVAHYRTTGHTTFTESFEDEDRGRRCEECMAALEQPHRERLRGPLRKLRQAAA